MTILIGLVVSMVCILGSYSLAGGHVEVIWEPLEFTIILGSGVGSMIVANPMKVMKDTCKGTLEAFKNAVPTNTQYLEILGVLYSLMRELRGKSRNEVEAHIDKPEESSLFQKYPTILTNADLTVFICDYVRLIIIGNARTHEIESLMDEEIQTIRADKMKAYSAMSGFADSLPALGIVAAVLGVVKAMGSIKEPPEVLGHLIGAALVGTFAGILFSYGIFGPLANKIKITREKNVRLYVLVKQTLLAFMNGAMPQVALEYGRKTISGYERPTIDEVEQATQGGGGGDEQKAA